MPLADLREEAAEIARRDSFYAEVAALRTHPSSLMPAMARTTLQSQQMPTTAQGWPPTSQVMLPNTPPPKYHNPPSTPRTPTQSKQQPDNIAHSSPSNLFQNTPNMGCIPFTSPATSTTTTPSGRTRKAAHDQFIDWDQCIPYPKSVEGKAT